MHNVSPDHSESLRLAYRAYLIGADGKVDSSVNILAGSDEATIEQVRELTRTHEVELWDRSRLIVRMPSQTAQ